MRHARFRLIAIATIVVCGGCLVFQALASPSQASVKVDKVVNLDLASDTVVANDALSVLTLSGTVGAPRNATLVPVYYRRLLENSPFLPRRGGGNPTN